MLRLREAKLVRSRDLTFAYLVCTLLLTWESTAFLLDLRFHSLDTYGHAGGRTASEIGVMSPVRQRDGEPRPATPESKAFSRPGSSKRRPRNRQATKHKGMMKQAILVEARLLGGIHAIQESLRRNSITCQPNHLLPVVSFPTTRECNAALAAFGDNGDLLRALKLFYQMRKVYSLGQSLPQEMNLPAPTLVTYSTIMSRAVHLGKPLTAIRIWNVMREQPDFFSSTLPTNRSGRIVPDVRAANILMNCYAKLGDFHAAQGLLCQMVHGGGQDVPPTTPTLVTFNTLLDACHKAGELDAALLAKEQLDKTGLKSDARTYTTLIATVARKASNASGANDPTLAFSFLEEMKERNIRPNGKTYSALIDVCGRCRRSDLALKGLRLMMEQKAEEREQLKFVGGKSGTLQSEVGAWTAAINACGRHTGRIETAIKLFYSMPKFGVYPNAVTCGCLTDCLLRNGRIAESLDVLRYMKQNHIAPSEVMYTSLMSSAGRLALLERGDQSGHRTRSQVPSRTSDTEDSSEATSAVQVYTELMKSLVRSPGRAKALPRAENGKESEALYRVSLVFQEMKASGVEPDLACYNALLRSCANAGALNRARRIVEQIQLSRDMEPNDKTWREYIRAAGNAGRVDLVLSVWKDAVGDMPKIDDEKASRTVRLSVPTFCTLLEAVHQSVSGGADIDRYTKLQLYNVTKSIYGSIVDGGGYMGTNAVDGAEVLGDPYSMALFLRTLVGLEQTLGLEDGCVMDVQRAQLRDLISSIVNMTCLEEGLPFKLRRNRSVQEAYNLAKSWSTKSTEDSRETS